MLRGTRKLSFEEIGLLILKHYASKSKFLNRPLLIHKSKCNYGSTGAVFFAVNGSPPKGFAIYIPDMGILNIYDIKGKQVEVIHDVVIPELNTFKNNMTYKSEYLREQEAKLKEARKFKFTFT